MTWDCRRHPSWRRLFGNWRPHAAYARRPQHKRRHERNHPAGAGVIIMPIENKCPLCGKVNPATEWVCEDCGAQLPMHGQRASGASATHGASAKASESASTASSIKDIANAPAPKSLIFGCGLAAFFFVLLPLSCAVMRSGDTPAPVAVTAPVAVSPPAQVSPPPAAPVDPCAGGATAVCSDGSLSFASGRRGACSGHGGVARWCR